jgi:hypothetical protein
MKRALSFALWLLLSAPALAGSGTVAVTPGTGATYATTTDASSYNYSRQTIWDYSAAAYGASVNSSHELFTTDATTHTDLGTINTTLGSPFQAGGALGAGSAIIGKVGIDQTTPGTTNGVVINNSSLAVTGTFWQTTQPVSGTFWQTTQPVSASSLPLPTGAATSANQTNASQKSQIVDGSGNVIGSTSNALNVNIENGASGGTALADGATFTIGTTSETPIGCTYVSGGITVTSGKASVLGCDAAANLNVNVKSATGLAIGSTTSGQTGSMVMGAATTYAPTTTTADTWPLSLDAVGNARVVQQASGSKVTGTANVTGTSSTSLIGAVTSERIYVQAVSCSNSGATSSIISFQDGSGGTALWTAICPAGGGNNLSSGAPLFWTTAGNALYFASGSSSSTVYVSAAGYAGN